MSDRTPLCASDVEARVANLDSWTREGSWLVRSWEFADFEDAMSFILAVADVARALDHHPNLANVYNRVELRVSTHDAGGLTSLDFEFADRVSRIEPL